MSLNNFVNTTCVCFGFFCIVSCDSNEECQLTEACINNACQRPCDIHNPCAHNAVCINTNHGSDCSCAEGFQGNGYVGCVPGKNAFQQYHIISIVQAVVARLEMVSYT